MELKNIIFEITGHNVSNFSVSPESVLYLKGYLQSVSNTVKTAEQLWNFFSRYPSVECAVGDITGGSFVIVYQTSNTEAYVITDIIRSYPIFIVNQSNLNYYVSTDLHNIDNLRLDLNEIQYDISAFSFLSNQNFYKQVYTCQAAEIVSISSDKLESKRYFEFIPTTHDTTLSVSQFVRLFNNHMNNVFQKMFKSVGNINNWVVPLSGGHDSRILINFFMEAGIRNVICYSYGTKGNVQAEISKQIAELAGYSWYFIEYTEEKWKQLHTEGHIDSYVDFAFQGVSTPHLQDFLAIHELKKHEIIKERDIIVPGHALDFVAGSHFTELDLDLTDSVTAINRVINKFEYTSGSKDILKDIISNFNGLPFQFQEYINWQERQTKFIVNSCRVYEYYNLEFRLPFWDLSFVSFWMQISYKDRLRRNLFLKSERSGILNDKLANIPFDSESTSKSIQRSWKSGIKNIIPYNILVFLLRISGYKSKLSEGMNLIFSSKGDSIRKLLHPIDDFPSDVKIFFKPYLNRFPFQMNPHLLSFLYALRRALNKIR